MQRRRLIPFLLTGAIGFALLGTWIALRNYRPMPRIRALDSHKVLFPTDVGSPGLFADVYTYRGTVSDVAKGFESELSPQGYVRSDSKRGPLRVSFMKGVGLSIRDYVAVDISPGRTTGKHFVIDGDFLNGDSDPEWVTVTVTAGDPLPIEVRDFLSWPN